MNTYSPQSLGINAPSGGFQNGGWYSGRQYFNGTLSDPGVIHPQSSQQGAGQAVSQEVIAQTNPKNVAYVNQQRQQQNLPPSPSANNPAPAPANPTNPAAGSTAGLFGGGGTTGGLDLVSMQKTLAQNAGVSDLQTKSNGIQAQIDTLTGQKNEQISYNNENPFLSEANRVGRQSKINTDAQNQIDALTNEKNSVDAEIAQKNTDIQNQLGLATQQFQINDQQHQEALSQFNTLLSSGLLSNLSGTDIANIASSTGLPTGIIQAAMTKSKQSDISPQMVTDPNSGTITMIDANTGNIIHQSQIPGWTGGSSGSTTAKAGSAEAQSQATGDMQSKLESKLNSYNNISPSDWQSALSAWLAAGFKKSDFIANFGQYADTNRGDFYTAYGFNNPKK